MMGLMVALAFSPSINGKVGCIVEKYPFPEACYLKGVDTRIWWKPGMWSVTIAFDQAGGGWGSISGVKVRVDFNYNENASPPFSAKVSGGRNLIIMQVPDAVVPGYFFKLELLVRLQYILSVSGLQSLVPDVSTGLEATFLEFMKVNLPLVSTGPNGQLIWFGTAPT
jgi:hypothetical protein